MAALIHSALVRIGVAAPPQPLTTPATTTTAPPPKKHAAPVRVATTALPVAHEGARYSVVLEARAGTPPYSWSFPHKPPAGLHVQAKGRIFGEPTGRPGTFPFEVRVVDASGRHATATLRLRVAR